MSNTNGSTGKPEQRRYLEFPHLVLKALLCEEAEADTILYSPSAALSLQG